MEQPKDMAEMLRSVTVAGAASFHRVVNTIATRELADLSSDDRLVVTTYMALAQATAMKLTGVSPDSQGLRVPQTDHYYRTHDTGGHFATLRAITVSEGSRYR